MSIKKVNLIPNTGATYVLEAKIRKIIMKMKVIKFAAVEDFTPYR